jgi:hypothetical protein
MDVCTFFQLFVIFVQLFVSHCSHPKWTPVTVVTQGAEVWAFTSIFRDWLWTNLAKSPNASKLRLPLLRAPSITYPATGKLKVLLVVHTLCLRGGSLHHLMY